ncbi:MAG: hypothetical protein LUI87_06730, partial [Lachnospiraceae bacterium]|nr:hypothetical protein [Lachnospiraceae bacterium]
TVTGTLMVITETDEDGNPTAWEAAVDDDGNAITVTESLDTGILSDDYEDSVSGYLPLQFTFSALNLSGKTTVVFETISRDGVDVLNHADINDEAQTVEITPYDITVEISKKDITNDEELPGAHLFIRDEDGNVVEEWISTSEPHQIVNLALGTYTLTEVTAPDGYEVAETIEFTVEDTIKIQIVTMYDSPKEGTVDLTGKIMTTAGGFLASAVKTGDAFRYLPAILLIALGVSGTFVFTRKGKNGKRKKPGKMSKKSDQ